MDGLVFIAALGVAVALIGWYAANEAGESDGGLGLFALKDDAPPAGALEAGPRYRARARLAPANRGAASRPGAQRAYRVKRAARPQWRFDAGAANAPDDEA
ncbi:MAG TPA: hypothetical protein PKM48_08075 [Parvularculaceae bacterium]|nr:hypothetical protein [Parvularculaceae bacterium]